jgi:hypothetical protein
MVKTASLNSLPAQYHTKDLYGPWHLGNRISASEARAKRMEYLERRKRQYRNRVDSQKNSSNSIDED